MPVRAIDHLNLRAEPALLERLRAFYHDILGLEDGARPPFESAGYWLYADGRPIVHLVETRRTAAHRAVGDDRAVDRAPAGYAPDSGLPAGRAAVDRVGLDHVALRCSGLAEMVGRLVDAGIPYAVSVVPVVGQVQVLIEDPSGIKVELIFAQEEGARAPASTAAPL